MTAMSTQIVEDVAERVIEQVKLADKLIDDQFDGVGPGMSETDDATFYALFLMRMAEMGPDFTRVLDAKKPDGTDLVPGGRAVLRKFLRLQAQRTMASIGGPQITTVPIESGVY